MNKGIIFFLNVLLVCSCKGQIKTEHLIDFENELSKDALKEHSQNSPFSNSEIVSAEYKYYNYFEMYGNSGSTILYNLDSKLKEKLEGKFKNYERLNNSLLKFEDSEFIYKYENRDVKIPEIPNFEDELSNETPKDQEIEIYLIKTGRLQKAFAENISIDKKDYKFSCGIYILKNQSKILYWFLIY